MPADCPWTLGIASSHNGGACILHGSEVIVAIQEERLLRQKRAKHPAGFPSLAVSYCLDYAGITASQLDAVTVCAVLSNKTEYDDIYLNRQLQVVRNRTKVFVIPHHFGHAVAVYALSGMSSTGILVVDGNGSPWNELFEAEQRAVIPGQLEAAALPDRTVPRENISLYIADDGNIRPVEKYVGSYGEDRSQSPDRTFQSLGDMYGFFGKQIFGSFFEGPGKLMGLSAYGKPTIPIYHFYHVTSLGFEFQPAVAERFINFGRWPAHQDAYQDLAASVQNALEEAVLLLCTRLIPLSKNLCYAGGVALNSIANERIVREAGFENVFIMPAAEDSGTAIGAAYYGLWQLCGYCRRAPQIRDDLGRRYKEQEIYSAIHEFPGVTFSRKSEIVEETAGLLAEGKIVGWFEGGSELGPRALGQRSILCDPRSPDIKEFLNSKVKFREGFRPFAPVIREEDVYDWFDVEQPLGFSPFMLRVLRFRAEQACRVPAVVHVDCTGRVQTVSSQALPKLHALLTAFKKKTDVPILLNTSFNIAGEPIVETPSDALWCFLYTELDACVLETAIVFKETGIDAVLDHPMSITAESIFINGNHVDDARQLLSTQSYQANELLVSGHISRLQEISQRPETLEWLRAFVIVNTPWGKVVHGLSAGLAQILSLINGRRNGRQIWALIGKHYGENTPVYAIAKFRRHLALLKRLGAIGFTRDESAKS